MLRTRLTPLLVLVSALACTAGVALAAAWESTPVPGPPPAVPAPADTGAASAEAVCPDVETAEVEGMLDEVEFTAAAGGRCKSCKGREWCACTYQGKPRVSCDPCCYQGAWDPWPVCFD